MSASTLIDKMYATRGYRTAPLTDHQSPQKKTFLASEHNVTLGTMTIGFDSPAKLLVDELFHDEVEQFRNQGFEVGEFIKLAMDRRPRSQRLLASLFHVAYLYAHKIRLLDKILIEVNPRHVRYYESMLGFRVIGSERHNPRVDAPAVLLALDLTYAEEQIRRFGGDPDLYPAQRSAYPYFFSQSDEFGILGRLHRSEEHIADVFEVRPPRVESKLQPVVGSLH